MSSKAQRQRKELERENKLNPELKRQQWSRKPQTQVVMNKKAEQRRSQCRKKWHDDGAVLLYSGELNYFERQAKHYLVHVLVMLDKSLGSTSRLMLRRLIPLLDTPRPAASLEQAPSPLHLVR